MIQILTGGITNHLFAYYIEGKFDEDVVLLRIEGVGTDQMANRKQEHENLQVCFDFTIFCWIKVRH